ncbi:MAG: Ig-like domain-containing protein, partial [Planctomycetaceae bacterium]|nr:Ig-like domain-containing protein [Planctomycetaceae bacterium]
GVAYVAAGSSIYAYDVLTGDEFQRLRLGRDIVSLAQDEGRLFSVDHLGRLQVIDLSFGTMHVNGAVDTGVVGNVFVGGGIAYIGQGGDVSGGFATVDVADVDFPSLLSGIDANNIVGQAIAANGSGLAVSVGSLQGVGVVLHVLDVSDPTNTNGFVTQFALPEIPSSVLISSGIAYVADGTGGLQVVNYRSFDNLGNAPTVTLTTDAVDVDSVTAGVQVQEGTVLHLDAEIIDDVQVRNVELLLNGEVIRSDSSFPFDLTLIAPTIAAAGDTITVQLRATDTGGNTGISAPLTLNLIPDSFAPSIDSTIPADGAVRGQHASTVRIQFTEPMATATLTADNMQLTGPNGLVATENIRVRNNDRFVQLTYSQFAAGEYTLTLKSGAITDRAGNPLGTSDHVQTFTVLENTAVWGNPAGGDWHDPENWDSGTVPAAGEDVYLPRLDPGAAITIRQDVDVNSLVTDAAVELESTLSLRTTAEIRGMLTLRGTILGGTVNVSSGNALISEGGTLDGVTVNGNITVGGIFGQYLYVTNG